MRIRGELRPGDRIAGCVIESELGRGGMGVVYRACQESLQRTVAVKVVSPALAGGTAFARRFKRRARLAASIEHPSVVPIYDAGEEYGGRSPRGTGGGAGGASGTDEEEHALLTDFGLAKEVAGQSGLTAPGQVLGALDYLAPELPDSWPWRARAPR